MLSRVASKRCIASWKKQNKEKAVAWYFRAAAFCIGEKISKDGLSMAHEGVATELTIIDGYDKRAKKFWLKEIPKSIYVYL